MTNITELLYCNRSALFKNARKTGAVLTRQPLFDYLESLLLVAAAAAAGTAFTVAICKVICLDRREELVYRKADTVKQFTRIAFSGGWALFGRNAEINCIH